MVGVHIGQKERKNQNIAVRLNGEKRKKINNWVSEIACFLNLSKKTYILGGKKLEDEISSEVAAKWSTKLMSLDLSKLRSYSGRNAINAKGLKLIAEGNWERLKKLFLGK